MSNNVENRQGKMIGRYQLGQLLGRGGMGEVWLATDTQLRRQIALKLLPAALENNRAYLDDFSYEARASAALEHPHILTIHDFGEHETEEGKVIPYLVMPYVNGGTLSTRIHANSGVFSVQESLNYLKQAALAIDYAHSKQVLHRDIKPANMLLQDDWLLLADFGIAKVLSSMTGRDQTHTGAGTPEYMAPEQIAGNAEPASDRYSLAVIAYQLFTGFLPFHGNTPYETYSRQLNQAPPAPRQFNTSMPLDIEHVLLLGLSKNPQERAPSCTVFVEALERGWMSRIQPTPDSDATQLAPWSRRWQGGPANSSASLPQSTGSPVPIPNNPSPNASSPSLYSGVTVAAPPAATPVNRRLVLAGGIAAAVVVGGGIVAASLLSQNLAAPVKPMPTPTPIPGPRKLIPGVPMLALTGHKDMVWLARWDPTGRYLVTAGKGTSVMLWDLAATLQRTKKPTTLAKPLRTWTVANIDFANDNTSLCWSRDGQKLIFGHSGTDKIYVLDAFNPSATLTAYRDDNAASSGATVNYGSVCAGPQADMFSIVVDQSVQVWQIGHTHGPINTLTYNLPLSSITGLNWSSDGKTLAAFNSIAMGTALPQLLLWPNSPQASAQAFDLPAHNPHDTFFRMADSVVWSPTQPEQVLISDVDLAQVWDSGRKKPLYTIGGMATSTTPEISGLSWSPNGRYIASSYVVPGDNANNHRIEPMLHIWDTQQFGPGVAPNTVQRPALSFGQSGALQHTQSIIDVQWSPYGRYLATASLDKTVIIWKVDGA